MPSGGVSNLRIAFGSPLSLHVVLDECGYQEQTRNACLVYFRIVDEHRDPLPEVTFSPELVSGRPSRTDGFGRWQSMFRGDHELVFTKAGFAPTTSRIHWEEKEEVDVEVVMTKAGGEKR
jgi:hypothetical protein